MGGSRSLNLNKHSKDRGMVPRNAKLFWPCIIKNSTTIHLPISGRYTGHLERSHGRITSRRGATPNPGGKIRYKSHN